MPSYTVGYIDVYRNGVRLVSTDFTATTGTTVVLVNACTSGDSVVTESFLVSSVLNAIPATAGAISSTYLASSLTLTTPTLTSPTITGAVVSSMASSVITSGTTQASTSGTSIDFTSIPSWVKRITVMFNGMSLNASVNFLIQIGSGSITSSGYNSTGSYLPGGTPGITSSTAGFIMLADSAPFLVSGTLTIFSMGSNVYVSSHAIKSATTSTGTGGGDVTLAGALDRVRITSTSGTATFDAGSINILTSNL